MKKSKFFCYLCFMSIVLLSCKSEYQQYVEREMASGVVQDSLIFDMRMGQTKKDFYAICWELNKQQVITAGTGNKTARYTADVDTLGDNAEAKDMLFYAIFDEEDVIRGMEMTYSYLSWAPWNRDRHADSLLYQLRDQYLEGYPGNDFIEVKFDIKGKEHQALVKIDGNRQILMYPKDNKKDVMVRIEDLRHKLKR